MKLTDEQQAFVLRHQRYAVAIARNWNSRDDQLVSEAMLALCKAAVRYDPTKGSEKRWVICYVRSCLKTYMTKNPFFQQMLDEPVIVDETPLTSVLPAYLQGVAQDMIDKRSVSESAKLRNLSWVQVQQRRREIRKRLT